MELNLKQQFKEPGDESNLILGIRPEHILLESKDGTPTLPLPCRVDLMEPMGAETYLYLISNAGHTLVARVDPGYRVEVGQNVTAHIPVPRFHLFRESDTARLARTSDLS